LLLLLALLLDVLDEGNDVDVDVANATSLALFEDDNGGGGDDGGAGGGIR
jgi:hypothetical protein